MKADFFQHKDLFSPTIHCADDFIKNGLVECIKKFPAIRLRCEHDQLAILYMIEVVPNEVHQYNKEYISWENQFTDQFIERFPNEGICFISDKSLVGLSKIDFELCGDNFKI